MANNKMMKKLTIITCATILLIVILVSAEGLTPVYYDITNPNAEWVTTPPPGSTTHQPVNAQVAADFAISDPKRFNDYLEKDYLTEDVRRDAINKVSKFKGGAELSQDSKVGSGYGYDANQNILRDPSKNYHELGTFPEGTQLKATPKELVVTGPEGTLKAPVGPRALAGCRDGCPVPSDRPAYAPSSAQRVNTPPFNPNQPRGPGNFPSQGPGGQGGPASGIDAAFNLDGNNFYKATGAVGAIMPLIEQWAATKRSEGEKSKVSKPIGVIDETEGLSQGPVLYNGRGSASLEGDKFTIDGGAGLSLGPDVQVVQSDPSTQGSGEVTSESTANLQNIDALIREQVVLSIPGSAAVTNDGISGNSPTQQVQSANSIPIVNVFFLPFRSSLIKISPIKTNAFGNLNFKELITGNAISNPGGNSVVLQDHKFSFSGNGITAYALKSFESVEGTGTDLTFRDGNIWLGFEAQRLMYSRVVYNADYGIEEIIPFDKKNIYNLQHYTDRLGILTDQNNRISVGDITSPHPTRDLPRGIATHRLSMFS
jgi:hypothetical protein